MPAKNPRLNIVVEKSIYEQVKRIAKKRGISLSLTARDLIKEALELREDLYWSKVVERRADSVKGKRDFLDHSKVWG